MKSYEKTRAPRPPAGRRNDVRTLLRSRTVKGVLVVAAGLQGATAMARHDRSAAAHASAPTASMDARALPGVRVAAPQTVAALRVEEDRKAAADTAAQDAAQSDTPALERSRELATRYRRKGYPVTMTLAERIHAAATEAGIAPEVAFGLVRTESAFRSSATSHVGAIGLTQLMPGTARWLEPGTTRSDLRDPNTNLRIGFRYLSKLIERYDGDTRLALTAYNRGPGTVDRVLKRGGDPDNGYADMVLNK
ncbi:MAG: hypothetical protein JWM27_2391 [Gemmatimonadetes bacterium]|nr:hypothetical protein [Gemmatimonadota bacterium]